ncbi:hypothetical protein LTR56_000290 [Elasticomyces elasticus]|nr:hypothetical protein LTR56_000290 [Elasticomyces elasticus]KAK3667015.1 hypothetical protein LTR22_002240 [Elasticomyces elasticus]KAK4933282.1 hypothetical protein LTR49_000276 [Elasticomyces elasticus]KAK5757364.1 hypothetical protein LTS12_012576 [Elasticomyces elasticus]
MEGDFSSMFGKDRFSDVIIKFGDRELPVHKMVLSTGSTYFKKLLEDKSVKTIKLDDGGKPDGIEGVLRYVYGLSYAADMSDRKNWRSHLDTAAVAEQYDLGGLKYHALNWFGHLTKAKMDMDMVKEILRALPRYRFLADKMVRDMEDTITNTYQRELLELPEFSNRFDMEPGAKLPLLLQDPEYAKPFDTRPGQSNAYLVQFGKAFKDLQDKLDEHGTIWPQHFREIIEQATKRPESLPEVMQQQTQVKEDPTQQPVNTEYKSKQQPVKVKEEREQPLVKVKDEPKETPSKKRKTQSVVRIEIG